MPTKTPVTTREFSVLKGIIPTFGASTLISNEP